jgi:hypothetical protein
MSLTAVHQLATHGAPKTSTTNQVQYLDTIATLIFLLVVLGGRQTRAIHKGHGQCGHCKVGLASCFSYSLCPARGGSLFVEISEGWRLQSTKVKQN